RQERAAEQAGPECYARLGERWIEIEQLPAAGRAAEFNELIPSTGKARDDNPYRRKSAGHIDGELYAVVPHDRAHAASARIDRRNDCHRNNARDDIESDRDVERPRAEKQTQAVRQVSRYQKYQRREPARDEPEATFEHVVSTEHLAAKISGQQENNNREPADDVAECDLQKRK